MRETVAETVLAEVQATLDTGESSEAPEAGEETTPIGDNSTEAASEPEATEPAETDAQASKRRSLSWSEAIDRSPPDIAQMMRDFQGDYTRKAQAVADQRREITRDRSALRRGMAKLKERQDTLEGAATPEYDPFNVESVQARIEAEVVRRLQEVMEPMEREYLTLQAEDSYQTFLRDNPDFKTDEALRKDVQGLLEGNEQLDLETAYWAAKGRRSNQAASQQLRSRSARRKAEREAANTATGIPRRPSPTSKPKRKDLRGMSASDLYRLAQDMHKNQ